MLFLKFLCSCSLLLAVSSWLFGHNEGSSEFPEEYGVDVSFPIHYSINAKRYSYQHERYRKMMSGCYKKYSTAECDSYERDRLEMNRNQPPTQHNYTELGFKHIRLPEPLWIAIKEYYDKMKTKESVESWPRGNTYVNHWDSPTYMVHLDMQGVGLRGGKSLREQIFENARPILEEWTGHKLEPTSLYGIRVYKNGAVLSPHVDRLPLVSSAIIQVDQDINEPWPVEVYDHAGNAHNVTMKPGDMVLYESHTVIHGRPFPLNGSYYANIFVHFQPVDHKTMNDLDHANQHRELDHKDVKQFGGHENHIVPKAEQRDAFRRTFEPPIDRIKQIQARQMENKAKQDKNIPLGTTAVPEDQEKLTKLRQVAAKGDLTSMQTLLEDPTNVHLLEYEDKNKWRILHESIRSGNLDLVKLVVSKSPEVNSIIGDGKNALWLSKTLNPQGSPITDFLISVGAKDV